VLRRHAHLHHYAVAVAFPVLAVLLGQRDMAARDALREALELLHTLPDVDFDPLRAVDVVKDDLRGDAGHSGFERCVLREFPGTPLARRRA
jgi:hypothetical protein